MKVTLHVSWPLLFGVLFLLFSTQHAAAILLKPTPARPLPELYPGLEQVVPPDELQLARQELSPTTSETVLPEETVVPSPHPTDLTSGGLPRDIASPAAATTATAEILPGQDQPLSSHNSPSIPPGPPTRLVILAIELDAPVVPALPENVTVWGKEYQQWAAPDRFAAGWHATSAEPGSPGNTVLNGHHNIKGEVFKRLEELSAGDEILVYTFEGIYGYEITNTMIFPEKYEQLDTRMNNAQWILPSQDERLTLVTCWPYESNTHRLIIVAQPVFRQRIVREVQ